MSCFLINQYSTGLFVSYSVKNPITQNYTFKAKGFFLFYLHTSKLSQ
jgi:hypothetical protein